MQFLREDLRGFKGYHVEECDAVKLDANESPYPLPKSVHQAFLEWCEENKGYNRYPDTDCSELKVTLAKTYDLSPNQFIIGVGSDQIIDFTLRLCVAPGEKVMFPKPSFSMYKLSTVLNHGSPVEIALDDDFEYEADKIIEAMKIEQPKVLILCSPNNPTGTRLSKEDLIRILDRTNCLVIMDEAYGEFMGFSAIELIDQYKNLLVLRTFSKAFGLAGLRIGYGVANAELIRVLEVGKPPYNLNTISQKLAAFTLENAHTIGENIYSIISERERVYNEIEKLKSFKVYRSYANFLFVIQKNKHIGNYLLERGILIKTIDEERGYYRIAIGLPEENNELLKNLLELEERMNASKR